jgi:hypothetical protein
VKGADNTIVTIKIQWNDARDPTNTNLLTFTSVTQL